MENSNSTEKLYLELRQIDNMLQVFSIHIVSCFELIENDVQM